MKTYYSGSPDLHHYFLKILGRRDYSDVSCLRFDHHADFEPCALEPCAMYVHDIQSRFHDIIWVNKPCLNIGYERDYAVRNNIKPGDFLVYDYTHAQRFFGNEIGDLIKHLDGLLSKNVIIDVDPDIIKDYPCRFDTGLMSVDELAFIIKSLERNVLFFFFASTENFAREVVSKTGFTSYECIEVK